MVVAANLLMTGGGLVMIVHGDVTECGRNSEGYTPRNMARLRNAEQLCIVPIIVFLLFRDNV